MLGRTVEGAVGSAVSLVAVFAVLTVVKRPNSSARVIERA